MIQLSPCTLTQIDELIDISHSTFIEAYAHNNTPENMAHYLATSLGKTQLCKELENPACLFFLAKQNHETVGYLKLNLGAAQTDLHDANSLEIERIYIKKSHYGTGISDILVQKALALAQERHLNYIWLGVWENNPRAIRFYEKQGFVPFGEHVFVFGDDNQKDILMRYELA